MSSSNDSDLFDTLSLVETDDSSDFELVDLETEERPSVPSSTCSDMASSIADISSAPPSPSSMLSLMLPNSTFPTLSPSFKMTDTTLSQHSEQAPDPPLDSKAAALELSKLTLSTAFIADRDLGDVEKMNWLAPADDKQQCGPSQLYGRMRTTAPKAAWLVAVLAAFLLGFKADTLLDFTRRSSSSLSMQAGTPSPSPSSLSVPKGMSSYTQSINPDIGTSSKLRRSVALQQSPTASKSLTIRSNRCADAGNKKRPSNDSNPPLRSKTRRYATFAGQMSFQMRPDIPVLPFTSDSSYLDNATTTTWAFWLAELHKYMVLQPALLAARTQAFEAARLAHRYHHEQLLPALASLREHAVHTAQRTAEFTAQYSEEQVRPAFAFVREQASQTAQRTAEYHEKVVAPAFAQFRKQAIMAAKSSSEGLNKAAQRFSSEAAQTVQQVKDATNINLDALGLDEYAGFVLTTLRTMKHNLRRPEKCT
ncbi:uncharacterized protein UTRI_05604 [Ustilago trichophora]|uniref:Uncharacterized protein n=1 Tax=Ustilago trichophora TaxID=86804 RepID=A0A5C3EFK0_9BASI|nr:uncharacterized protein UTRI_05604 [Ustilago trichophora]